jgi:hypothetical protein
MKTIGRILIILAVFIALSGLMVVAVNASGANAPDFGGPLPQIRPGDNGGDQFSLENGLDPKAVKTNLNAEDGEAAVQAGCLV